MGVLATHAGLYTDHYELTMAQGYYLNGRQRCPACFDYFFRKAPFDGSYVIFAGLWNLLEILESLSFDAEDCAFLKSRAFDARFVDYLSSFAFQGAIHSAREGEIVFPNEPVLRVEGNIIESQIIESLVLNFLNFQSLIATKAARLRQAARERVIIDFGLRRAQGLGGIHASRAAVIGGCNSTSNVYSAQQFDIPSSGTQAHSWIQSFDDELEAFRQFAQAFPEKCILLVDTYDTLKIGVPNAIKVAKEMKERGHRLFGIRLDSGDLAYLAKRARKMLDDASLEEVKIVASNQLDEHVIKSLLEQQAPIDAFGVGTRLASGQPDAALDGVYKLSMSDDKPRLKMSENIEKLTLPGVKHVHRYIDQNGHFYADGILLTEEEKAPAIIHPHQPDKRSKVDKYKTEQLMRKVMVAGEITIDKEHPTNIASFVKERLRQLPEEHKRFVNPHIYKVGISQALQQLRNGIVDEINSRYQKTALEL